MESTVTDQQRVSIEVAEHVATVTLVRGERHNALDGPMFRALAAAGESLRAERSARVVVLHGEGPSFCSGLDVKALASGDGGLAPQDLIERHGGGDANLAQEVAVQWSRLPIPVVAAVHGNCLGGGMQIALGADIRIVAPDAKLSIRESEWGLVPDMGITETLPGLVRPDVARELTYTARIVSGSEAVALGLATREAADPLAAAQALAAEIAGRSPDAVRAAKRLFREAPRLSRAEALALETELQVGLMGSPNQMAAVVAGMSGEPPQFADPA